jgi:hypothetical protein
MNNEGKSIKEMKREDYLKLRFYWEFSEIPPISFKDIRSFQRFCSGLIKNALRKWIL